MRCLLRRLAFSWEFESQWKELVGKDYNWRNFELLRIGLELGTYCGGYVELYLAFLGLNLTLRVDDTLTRSVFVAEMDQKMMEARDIVRRMREDMGDEEFKEEP